MIPPQQNYPSTNIRISDPAPSKDFPKNFNPLPHPKLDGGTCHVKICTTNLSYILILSDLHNVSFLWFATVLSASLKRQSQDHS